MRNQRCVEHSLASHSLLRRLVQLVGILALFPVIAAGEAQSPKIPTTTASTTVPGPILPRGGSSNSRNDNSGDEETALDAYIDFLVSTVIDDSGRRQTPTQSTTGITEPEYDDIKIDINVETNHDGTQVVSSLGASLELAENKIRRDAIPPSSEEVFTESIPHQNQAVELENYIDRLVETVSEDDPVEAFAVDVDVLVSQQVPASNTTVSSQAALKNETNLDFVVPEEAKGSGAKREPLAEPEQTVFNEQKLHSLPHQGANVAREQPVMVGTGGNDAKLDKGGGDDYTASSHNDDSSDDGGAPATEKSRMAQQSKPATEKNEQSAEPEGSVDLEVVGIHNTISRSVHEALSGDNFALGQVETPKEEEARAQENDEMLEAGKVEAAVQDVHSATDISDTNRDERFMGRHENATVHLGSKKAVPEKEMASQSSRERTRNTSNNESGKLTVSMTANAVPVGAIHDNHGDEGLPSVGGHLRTALTQESVNNAVTNATTETNGTEFRTRPMPPNGLYRFLLRRGHIGHVLVLALVLIAEWIQRYLPAVAYAITILWKNMAPDSLKSRFEPSGASSDDGMENVMSSTMQHRYSGRMPARGKERRALSKKADHDALQQLRRIGDIEDAKYRDVSSEFMKRHKLGPFLEKRNSVGFEENLSGLDTYTATTRKNSSQRRKELANDEGDSNDIDWVLQGLTAACARTPRRLDPKLSIGIGAGTNGPSLEVGLKFGVGTSSSVGGDKRTTRRRTRAPLDEAAIAQDAVRKRAPRPSGSDRDGGSGVIGRLRAAATSNSLVSRSIFGAYSGDAVAPCDAASARGVIGLARKYGYGEWSEDDEDELQVGSSRPPRKRRHESQTTSSMAGDFDFGIHSDSITAKPKSKQSRRRKSHSSVSPLAKASRHISQRQEISTVDASTAKQRRTDSGKKRISPPLELQNAVKSGHVDGLGFDGANRVQGSRSKKAEPRISSGQNPDLKGAAKDVILVQPAMTRLQELQSTRDKGDA